MESLLELFFLHLGRLVPHVDTLLRYLRLDLSDPTDLAQCRADLLSASLTDHARDEKLTFGESNLRVTSNIAKRNSGRVIASLVSRQAPQAPKGQGRIGGVRRVDRSRRAPVDQVRFISLPQQQRGFESPPLPGWGPFVTSISQPQSASGQR